ncbi:hypothetical protein DFH08DRAFT_874320 [Mycena albidolilacea]|uniref:Uncharacterized protein n=1 Tax=Mycena albidolilacea TaxID=1033008 RepID=A0AAD6ZVJ0_9AGAR|nr:hypothetical protein DFH08DRAFT_874320 [Mycena albidolilacea]
MKISNPTSSPVDTRVVVTYTAEPGDPQAFFFEVVDNGRRLDFADRQAFSGSGSFFTIPGDLGLHFIEAYSSTDVVGKNQPFAVGPTYTVLSAGPGSTTVLTPTTPITNSSTSTTSIRSTVATQITAPPAQNGAPAPNTALTPPSPTLSNLNSNSDSPKNGISTATLATTLYESILSNVTVQGGTVLVSSTARPSSPAIPSSSANGNNLGAIIGATVAGVVVVAVLVYLLVRRRWRKKQASLTINPFFALVARPSGRHRRGFTRVGDSIYSPTSDKTLSDRRSDTESREDLSGGGVVLGVPGQQLEWVLRPTQDPPPGYNVCL